MVAAANPLAAEAGREILRAGGSAVDAAIAVQLCSTSSSRRAPASRGAFMVHWSNASREVTTLDGRETAPAAAKPERFLGADGKPMKFYDAVVGRRSVGVPGTPRLLEEAHKRWGKLHWFAPVRAGHPARRAGFPVSPRLNGCSARRSSCSPSARAKALYYNADGTPLAVGATLKNPAFAATRALATKGADAFYEGDIAQDVVSTVPPPRQPGDMTPTTSRRTRSRERSAVCGRYRAFTVCGMGPPSSGAVSPCSRFLGVCRDAAT